MIKNDRDLRGNQHYMDTIIHRSENAIIIANPFKKDNSPVSINFYIFNLFLI